MILCLGTTPVYQRSMVFERLRINEVNRAAAVHDYASGKSINVARVLHTLGEDAVATGFVGRDERGDALLADLDRAGVRHDFVRVDPPARQCVTVIDRAGGTATELVEESQPVGAEAWEALDEKFASLAGRARGCVLSGSLPPIAPDDFYLSCLRRLDLKKVPVVLDARGGPLRRALEHPGPFVVKLNRDELASTVGATLGAEEDLRRAMLDILPAGGAVVVTLGAGGAVAADADAAWRIHAPRVTARSAVGSGDAFAAGIIMRLVPGRPLHEACAFGAACGAANALTDKAGFLSPGDVEALLPRVRVKAL